MFVENASGFNKGKNVIIYFVKKKYIIAVDEAGRGPLAGPISVAGVMMSVPYTCYRRYMAYLISNRILKGIRDSKKLSARQRAEWLEILRKNFKYHVVMVGPKVIDKIGISRATKIAVARVLRKFEKKLDLVILDGLLFAPKHYNQKTIIKGDEKVPLIAAASIIAKVSRDKKMLRLHKKFPCYCFNKHKGYATKLHYKMIKKYGFCPSHRRSFC